METIQSMKINENANFRFTTKEAAWAFAMEVENYGKSCDNKKVFAFSQNQINTVFKLEILRLH